MSPEKQGMQTISCADAWSPAFRTRRRWRRGIGLAASVLLATASAAALAQTTIDVAKITCEQYVMFKVTDPRYIGIWLSGYYHAKQGSTVVDVDKLEENAKKVTDFCRA